MEKCDPKLLKILEAKKVPELYLRNQLVLATVDKLFNPISTGIYLDPICTEVGQSSPNLKTVW